MTTKLKIQRKNTKKNQSAYDLFEWSKRDVIMRNWRDGSINFQQLGVEFPVHWSDNAVSIVTSKYFRGALNTASRETSLKQVIDRVIDTYKKEGFKKGYFDSQEDALIFAEELKFALVDQQFSFNSPVWFNVGTTSKPQISACFILAVQDNMESILDWYKEEGLIFKGGSGAGVNLSNLRSKKELLKSGGQASGPVSFMRGADASAGTIKSGGATRRAAKMVILDVDHPDIEEFIETKMLEENKIRALKAAGFDMDLGGKDSFSVQYQNANNSVRVNDKFMNAVETDSNFDLVARSNNAVIESVKAKELFTKIATAAWACADPGIQYDNAIQKWHTLPAEGKITATNPCSEFVHLDNSSCNLASIKLTKFYNRENGTFDIEAFQYLTRLITIATEISISFGFFPTKTIESVTKSSRPIGLGYTDLGALLMEIGLPYDSNQGRSWAAGITSLLSSTSYLTSAEMAKALEPFEYFENNKESMLNVIQLHKSAASTAYNDSLRYESKELDALHSSSLDGWSKALKAGQAHGFRNSQTVVIAPTGTISFFMDSTTTGIEPDLGLVKYKKIADGSSITIVNNLVPSALKKLGYNPEQVKNISEFILANNTILNAPDLKKEHEAVFACAMGDNVVSPMGHILMMAAVQPFVSGAISKTVNLPESATVEDIEKIYLEGWKLGLKCIAVYRDNCKVGQPLSVKKTDNSDKVVEQKQVIAKPHPFRVRLEQQRQAKTTSFSVGSAEGYVTTGSYPDGQLGEIFVKVSKQGSTLAGIIDAFAISVSLGLQYGVPLETYVSKFINTRFEPSGMTNDPDIRMASSLVDYIFKRVAIDYLDPETREHLGVKTNSERIESLNTAFGDSQTVDNTNSPVAISSPASTTADTKGSKVDIDKIKDKLKSDAPLCTDCGIAMVKAGSCYACPQCGTTTGCS